MPTIPANDARNTFTKLLVDKYVEMPKPTSFLSSMFKEEFTESKEISIEVQRGSENVSVDVLRHGEGKHNKMTRSTEKIFVPPYYNDYLTANDHRLYDVAIGTQHKPSFKQLVNELASDVSRMRDKQLRAYELQASQVLETGVVALNAATDIDFNRKAASMVDKGSSNYWNDSGVDALADLKSGCEFLRKTGKFSGGVVNAIFGSKALDALLNNAEFQKKAELRRVDIASLEKGMATAEGGVPHGVVTAGSWTVVVWSYPEFYKNSGGTVTPYVNDKKVVMIPEKTNFRFGFGLVPQLLGNTGTVEQKGAFLIRDIIDERKKAHEIFIESAGLAIPTAVDQIYTLQVLA